MTPSKEIRLAKSYAQVQAQIRKLQAEAEAIKAKETNQVITRIRVAIEHYGLTPEQLFGNSGRKAHKTAAKKAPARKSPAVGRKVAVKYRDGENTWTGRGNRPRWLVARLAEGRDVAEFKVD